MSKNKSKRYYNNLNRYCNSKANRYLILVTIYSAIISQEVENDEALGILASFLIALGEELALASEIRIACKAEIEESLNSEEEDEDAFVEDVFDRSSFKKTKVKNNKYKIKKPKKT